MFLAIFKTFFFIIWCIYIRPMVYELAWGKRCVAIPDVLNGKIDFHANNYKIISKL